MKVKEKYINRTEFSLTHTEKARQKWIVARVC